MPSPSTSKPGAPRAACLIGWPAKHSRSPRLHGYWLRYHGIAGDYRAVEVRPEDFPAFLRDLAAYGYTGANVTIPHKEAAFAMSEPDACASAVGAANTLWLDNGVLRSTNTDVEGFIASLDEAAPGWDRAGCEAVVIGAGGAARAVLYGLIGRGVGTIRLANRTFPKAEALRRAFGPAVVPTRWSDLPAALAGARLLINSSVLGMAGQPALELGLAPLADDAVVADNVYVPLTTPLLAAARARGLRTADGLAMLLHQAVRGFELWFGVRPEVTRELYDLIAADIEGR